MFESLLKECDVRYCFKKDVLKRGQTLGSSSETYIYQGH